MSDSTIIAGRIAGVISGVAFVPYFVSVVRGRSKPNQSTWLIWTIVGGVLCASHIAVGGGHSAWVGLMYVIGPAIMTLLALRYGEREWSRFDKVCLGIAAGSLAVWAISGNPVVALCMNITVDFVGALPTIRKSWIDPRSEDRSAWTLFLVANAINLWAIEAWRFSTAVYPIYLFVVTLFLTALLYRPLRIVASPIQDNPSA